MGDKKATLIGRTYTRVGTEVTFTSEKKKQNSVFSFLSLTLKNKLFSENKRDLIIHTKCKSLPPPFFF